MIKLKDYNKIKETLISLVSIGDEVEYIIYSKFVTFEDWKNNKRWRKGKLKIINIHNNEFTVELIHPDIPKSFSVDNYYFGHWIVYDNKLIYALYLESYDLCSVKNESELIEKLIEYYKLAY